MSSSDHNCGVALREERARANPHRGGIPTSKFVAGEENRLASFAVAALLAEPTAPDGPKGLNPLVLFGPSASGKTLLADELAEAWRKKHKKLPVISKPAVQFAQDFKDAVETQDVAQFRREHRRAGLLIIEDITHLAGKETAQRELRETIDALTRQKRRLLVTASLAPGQWPNVMSDLQARLMAGLSVLLVYPGRDSRLEIVSRQAACRGISLSDKAASLLASNVEGPATNLSGALQQLELNASVTNGHGLIDVEDVRRYFAKRQEPCQPELREIALETARSFSLKVAELRSRSRARAVVTARGVAMYVARKLTHKSLQQIGHYFGGRDHTTVLHGCRKTEALLNSEPAVQRAVEQVQNKLSAAG